jgi:hypothetical protein
MCVCMYVYVCVCVSFYVCVYVYVYVYLCVYVYDLSVFSHEARAANACMWFRMHVLRGIGDTSSSAAGTCTI